MLHRKIAHLDNSDDANSQLTICTSCVIPISIILGLLAITFFLILWTAFGIAGMFQVKKSVQFTHSKTFTYCHPVLYYTGWIYFILSLVVSVLYLLSLRVLRFGLSC